MFNTKKPTIFRQPKTFTLAKEKQPAKVPPIFFLAALTLVVFFILSYIVFISPLFMIKKVEIIGDGPEGALATIDKVKGENIFLSKTDKIEAELINKYPEILSLRIYRGIPNKLRAKFRLRSAAIAWQTQDQFYLVDNEAIVFKKVENISGLPLVVDTKNLPVKVPSEIATANFIKVVRQVPQSLAKYNLKINKFEVKETAFELTAVTDSFSLIFDTIRPLSDQIDAFEKVYKDHPEIKEYIDLRAEGKVYYK